MNITSSSSWGSSRSSTGSISSSSSIDYIAKYVSTGLHAFKIFSSYNTSFFQAFYDVVMSFFPLMDRMAQKNWNISETLCIMIIFTPKLC